MSEIYDQTALTPLRVAKQTGFIDWDMQPSVFKQYPDKLFGYDIVDMPDLVSLGWVRQITSALRQGRPYRQLNVPSAGNLHPLELYLQIRGLKGVLSGIYHLDVLNNRLVLLKEIGHEGLESHMGLEHKLNGLLYMISVVPFRSRWKYGERAWRYCYLDAGHQIAALQAASTLNDTTLTILSEIDTECLNAMMGFDHQEHLVFAAYSGEITDRPCKPLKHPLMQVQPTDYCEGVNGQCFPYVNVMPNTAIYEQMSKTALRHAILQRRSARQFIPVSLPENVEANLFTKFNNTDERINAYAVILHSDGMRAGLYLKGAYIKPGNYTSEIVELLVDQRFVASAAMVVIYTSATFSADALCSASSHAHGISLFMEAQGIGMSGIGAFYDRKLQHFLETDEHILYVTAIGRKTITQG